MPVQNNTNIADGSGFQDRVRAARAKFGFGRLDDWAVAEVAGPDAPRFLQNRLTSDVLALQSGQGQLSASVDRQSKIEGVFSLHRMADEQFLLLAPQSELATALAGIEKFHIIEQFKSTLQTGKGIFLLQGPEAPAFLQKTSGLENIPTKGYQIQEVALSDFTVVVVWRSLTGDPGFLLLVDAEQVEAFGSWFNQAARDAGGIPLDAELLDNLRIEAGLPWMGRDYDHDTLLPETGLERYAVSYSKGCYLGQETIARIKTYGMLQKALCGLLFEPDCPLPLENTPVLLDGKPVGILKSVTFSAMQGRPIGLAYLGKTERVPGRQWALEIDGKTYPATVALLPFYDGQAALKSGKALLDEGLTLFSEGYEEAAMASLHQAIEKQPDLLEAYEALGVMLSRHERYDEAIAMMNRILEMDPSHVLAHTNLSVFYMKLGDKEKAEEEKAKATMAAFSKKAKESGLVFDIEAEQRKKEQAALERITMFHEALQFNPTDPLGNFGLGSACLELKRYPEAIEAFQKVIQAQPKHSVAYLSLGKALEGGQQTEQAKAVYQQGIEVAAAKGDLMPLKEMQTRLDHLTLSKAP